MRNIVITVCLVVFAFICYSCNSSQKNPFGQLPIRDTSIVVNSLEGEPATVHIKPDYVNKRLTIQLSPSEVDSFIDFTGGEKIKILDKFISVSYGTFIYGAGTTYDIKTPVTATLFLCVSKGHLYKALDVISYQENYWPDTIGSKWTAYRLVKADFSLQHDKSGGYQLTETEDEKGIDRHLSDSSDSGKCNNYKSLDTMRYQFDLRDKLFYFAIERNIRYDADTSIAISSLEGEAEIIHVKYNYGDRILTIQLSPSELINCTDIMDIEKIKVFGPFISVQYDVRGGSGVGRGETVIIFVSSGKLCKALNIESLQTDAGEGDYSGTDDSLGLYYGEDTFNVNFLYMQKLKNGGYELTATQYEKVKFRRDTDVNHENLDTLKFTFDKEDGIFYTGYSSLQGSFVLQGGVSKMQKVFAGEKYPEIEIKGHYGSDFADEYFFIDGYWYDKDRFNKNCLDGPLEPCN